MRFSRAVKECFYARTPEAPEQIAFSDSRWIPMTWAQWFSTFFSTGTMVQVSMQVTHVIYILRQYYNTNQPDI